MCGDQQGLLFDCKADKTVPHRGGGGWVLGLAKRESWFNQLDWMVKAVAGEIGADPVRHDVHHLVADRVATRWFDNKTGRQPMISRNQIGQSGGKDRLDAAFEDTIINEWSC
ncbi:MAG: hypothetical protein P8Y96_13050 [Desulfuromonadales bacterium]|jgi:hypothetical protein